jgi:hypothetical protein
MYLYFHEDNFIVGLDNFSGTFSPSILDASDFDMDDKNHCNKFYDAWTREENNDGTFYLVFIFEKHKYYLTSYQIDDYSTNTMICLRKENKPWYNKIKMAYDEEGNIIGQKTNIKLCMSFITCTNSSRMSLTEQTDSFENKFSNKLCLTTSNKNIKQKLHKKQFELFKEELYKKMYHPIFYVKFAFAENDDMFEKECYESN